MYQPPKIQCPIMQITFVHHTYYTDVSSYFQPYYCTSSMSFCSSTNLSDIWLSCGTSSFAFGCRNTALYI